MDIPRALRRILDKADADVREENDKKDMSLQALHEEIERIIQCIETERERVVVPAQASEMDRESRGTEGSEQEEFSARNGETSTTRFLHFRDGVMKMIFRDQQVHALFSAPDSVTLQNIGHFIVIFAGLLLTNVERPGPVQEKLLNDLGRKVHAWAVDGQPRVEQTVSE
jgi:hypothetical protein